MVVYKKYSKLKLLFMKKNYFTSLFNTTWKVAMACCLYMAFPIAINNKGGLDSGIAIGILCFCYMFAQSMFNSTKFVLTWWPNILAFLISLIFFVWKNDIFNSCHLVGLILGTISGCIIRAKYKEQILSEGWLPM